VLVHYEGFALPFRGQVGRYLAMAGTQYAITVASTAVLPGALGVSTEIVYLATMAVVTGAGFVLMRFVIFHADSDALDPERAPLVNGARSEHVRVPRARIEEVPAATGKRASHASKSGRPRSSPQQRPSRSDTMDTHVPIRIRPHVRPVLFGVLLAGLLATLAPAASQADITNFGSSLSVPATLNTAKNLNYQGTNTAVPPSPEAPNGVFHTAHFGADTALWNHAVAGGNPRVPADGQVLKLSLEGCAQAAPGGPTPLTQIHFQDLTPLPGGGVKANTSSNPFYIPICGRNGASGSAISTYEPHNLCVVAGDYVGFNDDGGYVENVYRSGVAYQVIGAARGSTMDSFIKNNGTGNGAPFSTMDTTAMDGFASNRNEELMLRVTLGTGRDAVHSCPGGRGGLLAPIRVSPQTDGVNQARFVAVALFCRVTPCKGIATLSTDGGRNTFGRSGFDLAADTTTHLPIHVSSQMVSLIREHHGVSTTLTAVVAGESVSRTIAVKIF